MFLSNTESHNQFINTNTTNNIFLSNAPFASLNTFAGTGENFTNKLDEVWTAVNTEINDFLQLPDWEIKTRLAITGDWLETEAKDFFSNISPEQTSVEILPANNMPGIAGGYDAITGKIYLSEDLVKYSDPAKIADVLIEEIGHKADDILNPGQDSPGDEGEILAKLVSNQGSIPSDWQVLKQENDHKFIQVGDAWIGVEASENIKQEWLKQFGSKDRDYASDIALDEQGNIYLTGIVGNLNTGGLIDNTDIWVAKYNTEGKQQWIQQFGTDSWDAAYGIEVDGQGNIYLTGDTYGDLGGVNAGRQDAWVAKYNTEGKQQWIQQFGTDSWDAAYGIEVDGQGNIYLTGYTNGNLGGVNVNDMYSVWAAKYNAEGKQQWIQAFAVDNDKESYYVDDIQVDGQGNIYLAGILDKYDADGVYIDEGDIWVAKYNAEGKQQWIQKFGTHSSNGFAPDIFYDIALDGQGNIYLTGYTEGNLGGVNAGEQDAWVAKYNTQGKQQWIQQFGTDTWDAAYGIEVDGQGNIYLTGDTYGDLGGVNAGEQDAWVAKYNTQGKQQWIQQFGSKKDDGAYLVRGDQKYGGEIEVDGQGNIYLTGNTSGDLGGFNARKFDAWVAKFSQGTSVAVTPNISMQDVTITEGNSGQKNANFTVTLDQASKKAVTVQYTTVDDTAKAGQDFVKKTGKLTFQPGVKTQTITVPIIGDKVFEPDEKFSIKLSAASNGKITKANAIGTITNDDQKVVVLPNISIQDVSIVEGNSGQKNANFKVTLDKVSNQTVTVQYATVDDTATAGEDFTKQTGKLTFKPGVKTQTISVPIIGDKLLEKKEQFSIKLSQVSNGKITRANGIGSITNDDSGDVVIPTIPLDDKEPNNNNISKKLPTFSNVSTKPIEVLGEIGVLAGSQRDQDDYYRLILDKSENDLFVVLDGLQRDANLEILDKDGFTRLSSSEETGKTREKISTVLPAGTYYVRVKPQGTNFTNYRLSISI